ncbi:MAG: hypothetical protein GY679_01710 [Mycoplasma sp.]|nr:hypothetical protein [Mycoplasma sp.]
MGYYTEYSLEAYVDGELSSEIVEEVVTNDYLETRSLSNDGMASETTKWYGHESELIGVSNVFRDVLFVLKGNGEDFPDIWVKYFMNGELLQSSKAKIIYPKLGEEKWLEIDKMTLEELNRSIDKLLKDKCSSKALKGLSKISKYTKIKIDDAIAREASQVKCAELERGFNEKDLIRLRKMACGNDELYHMLLGCEGSGKLELNVLLKWNK